MKCLFTRGIQHLDNSTSSSNHTNENHYVNGVTSLNANGLQLISAVKFEIQVRLILDILLYKLAIMLLSFDARCNFV